MTGQRQDGRVPGRPAMRGGPALAAAMAFTAGGADAIGLAATGRYTAHMSGTTSVTMGRFADGEVHLALLGLVLIVSFLAGATACGFFTAWRHPRSSRNTLPVLLVVEAVLIGSAGLTLDTAWNSQAPSVAVAILAFGMGLQNATSSKLLGPTVRTTHVTGTLTDIGVDLGSAARDIATPSTRRSGLVRDASASLRSGALLAGFVAGGLCGTFSFTHFGGSSLLALAVFPLLVAILVTVADDLYLLH